MSKILRYELTRDIYAEEMYNFMECLDLWGAKDDIDHDLSIAEFIVWHCSDEFQDFLQDRGYEFDYPV